MNPATPMRMQLWILTAIAFLTGALACTASIAADSLSKENAAIETRILDDVKLLASDEYEGRGVGTGGIDTAAEFIAQQFKAAGLKTDLFDGSPFQKFNVTVGAVQGKINELAFLEPEHDGKPQRQELTLGKDFNPLALGGSAKFNMPLVFVGYGITAKDENYDDYAGIDVTDKAVIVLRHEPQQNNPHSPFNGRDKSFHAPYTRKIANAYEHGAGAVVFVTDQHEIQQSVDQMRNRWQAAVDELAALAAKYKVQNKPSAQEQQKFREQAVKLADDIKSYSAKIDAATDPLLEFNDAGLPSEVRKFAVVTLRRSIADRLIQSALGKSLAEIEAQIDKGPTPQSKELLGWRIEGNINVERKEAEVKNVAAVLEGTGPHAEETIVVGAHYDHLGFGDQNSLQPGSHEIHNGADDNASGTAVLVEIARQLADRSGKLPRRVLFLAFTGEERGLLGSAQYVRNPLVPLDKTVAMLNMDMVGRLQDNKLIVHGTDTATEFEELITKFNTNRGFEIVKKGGGYGPSDHSSFYAKQLPVLHFFTGSHSDYHRPSDDVEKLNVAGMRRVAGLVSDMIVALAEMPEGPHFQLSKTKVVERGGAGSRPTFGSIPDFATEIEGYALAGVTKDGPAERAGLKAGDVIVRLGKSKIGGLEDFDSALRKHRAGDKVPVVVLRDGKEVELQVVLDPPR